MGSQDFLEQYLAVNLVFEPLVGELFRSGFIMQCAAAQGDFVTPAVVSAAEADYQRNLANTVELISMLTNDAEHGAHNKQLFNGWVEKHTALCLEAGEQPAADLVAVRVKVASYADILAKSKNRMQTIMSETGLQSPAAVSA